MRKCYRCEKDKELEEFVVDKSKSQGRGYCCRPCKIKEHKEWRNKAVYGLTKDVFDALLKSQNNCCAICESDFNYTPHVDHCHLTNKVRGILCTKCNTGLGHFNDDIVMLEKAIAYLK